MPDSLNEVPFASIATFFLQEAYENRLEIPEEEEDKWWFLGMGLVMV